MKRPSFTLPKTPGRLTPALMAIPLIVLLAGGYSWFALSRPFPTVVAESAKLDVPVVTTAKITWPTANAMAVGINDYGVVASTGKPEGLPIASIAKTMLAVMVVKEKPLKAGEQGPVITITDKDVTLFKDFLAQNGSVVPVQAGETLTEYQALQALLLPSGDNIADTLAIWTYGSVDAYLKAANDYATTLGLAHTHLADASGLSPQTVSSASDLVLLGQQIVKEPVLAEIVNQSEVTLPIAGKVKNYNTLLGQEGVIGIKTGNTTEAGGCLLFASIQTIGGQPVTIVGAILGSTDRAAALRDTLAFLRANKSSFQLVTPIHKGDVVATYTMPWGQKVKAVAKQDATIVAANGQTPTVSPTLSPVTKAESKSAEVGSVAITSGAATVTVPVILDSPIAHPPFVWRLVHR